MKKIRIQCLAIIFIMMCFAMAGYGHGSTQDEISGQIGIDISEGTEVFNDDTHGGFHGDGITCIVLKFPDDGVINEIKEKRAWKQLPLNKTVEALVYGTFSEINGVSTQIGPYLTDQNGNALAPEIHNGYYFFRDRHYDNEYTGSQGVSGVLGRGSFNFTVALYDSDKNMLYYYKLDT